MLPEQRILVNFLNGRFEASVLAGLPPETWTDLVNAAQRHRIAPLLHRRISMAGAESMFPDTVIRKLRMHYLGTIGRNTILFHQLRDLLVRLNGNEIPVILLKGAHLAEFVYEDAGLRPMQDLDILVREKDLSRVVRTALESGFRFFFDENLPDETLRESSGYGILHDFKHYNALIHPETRCMLEIHCFIASKDSPFNIVTSELWDHAQPAMFHETPVLLLSPEDLIIHLCVHAAYDHLFDFGLGALYDIFATIDHYQEELNWEAMLNRSRKWHTSRCLQVALHFTKKWLETGIPDAVFKEFRMDRMVERAEERIFAHAAADPVHPHYLRLRSLAGWRARAGYIKSVLLPSRQFMASRYLKTQDSGRLFSAYGFRLFQAVKGLAVLIGTMMFDSRYKSRLRQGDGDFQLRDWLIRS